MSNHIKAGFSSKKKRAGSTNITKFLDISRENEALRRRGLTSVMMQFDKPVRKKDLRLTNLSKGEPKNGRFSSFFAIFGSLVVEKEPDKA